MNYNLRFIGRYLVNLLLSKFFTLILVVCLSFLVTQKVNAQASIRGLSSNAVIIEHLKNSKPSKNLKSLHLLTDTISLPFVDDFSTTTVYPNQHYWCDSFVFINSTFPVNPPSIGVATFDAFDKNGLIYAKASPDPFQADMLTSKPINLNYLPGDSIYLSFFYEPKGIGGVNGEFPEKGDSLLLDFFDPSPPLLNDSIRWKTIWSVAGDSAAKFHQKMIPITDTRYLKKGFRIRFRNLASIDKIKGGAGRMSNVDFWHLDYVKLDKGRRWDDTVLHDVAFVKPLTSVLKNYQAIPWPQFYLGQQDLMLPGISTTYRNNDNITRTTHQQIIFKDLYDYANTIAIPKSVEDDAPLQTVDYSTELIDFQFNPNTYDSALFQIKSVLTTDVFKQDLKSNDTLTFLQVFKNYYAYDDGSAESGFGIDGDFGQNAECAMQFQAYAPDTITAISFYFLPTVGNQSTHFKFRYAVWADNNGYPGQRLYWSEQDSASYGPFRIYNLKTPVPVSGLFYVGWTQYEDAPFLNIGVDLNTNLNPTKLFVNYQAPWEKSNLPGTLMIRPIIGKKHGSFLTHKPTFEANDFKLYPNPAQDLITIEGLPDDSPLDVTIYNVSGKVMLKITNNQSRNIDVSSLPTGLYFVKFTNKNNTFTPIKLLIQR